MNFWMSILRLVHIFGGIMWAGSGLFLAGFVLPASKLMGKEGQAFMQTLTGRTRFSQMMAASSGSTLLSGLIMYYLLFGFLAPLNTGPGLALTVGGLAGIGAFIVGTVVQGGSARRMEAIGKAVAAAGGPPSPEQLAELEQLQEHNARGAAITSFLFVIAIAGMTLSEYFTL